MAVIPAANSTSVRNDSLLDDVDQENQVSLRTTVIAQRSAGGQGFVKCKCSAARKCQENRCKCFK